MLGDGARQDNRQTPEAHIEEHRQHQQPRHDEELGDHLEHEACVRGVPVARHRLMQDAEWLEAEDQQAPVNDRLQDRSTCSAPTPRAANPTPRLSGTAKTKKTFTTISLPHGPPEWMDTLRFGCMLRSKRIAAMSRSRVP